MRRMAEAKWRMSCSEEVGSGYAWQEEIAEEFWRGGLRDEIDIAHGWGPTIPVFFIRKYADRNA